MNHIINLLPLKSWLFQDNIIVTGVDFCFQTPWKALFVFFSLKKQKKTAIFHDKVQMEEHSFTLNISRQYQSRTQ